MALFFQKPRKARQFEYKPRFYDPEKEAREERRKELCGIDSETVESAPYVPGQFLRQDMLARRGMGKRKKHDSRPGMMRLIVLLALAAVIVALFFRW